MLHHECDAPKGFGGGISFYSVSYRSKVIFNPSLLYIYIYMYGAASPSPEGEKYP